MKYFKTFCISLAISFSFLLFFNACSIVRLSKFEASKCKDNCKTGLISKVKTGNELFILYGGGAACCLEFKGKIKYANDTLFLKMIKYNIPCACSCGYEFSFKIKGLKAEDFVISPMFEWSRKNKLEFKKKEELKKLKISDPLKYDKIRKKMNKRRNRKFDRDDRHLERQNHLKEQNKIDNDDVYN